ncbi:hypothetical protein F5148DRAFT_843266 [Russula earlei]|uniref:Uncharacterized protein n=1 Tax=Russula earlei TaxID=71964 RepID=A0ACC0UAX1_9AGAM|nr:hypothetical protein F5148DRAFT_843266 [Russula earlei]
MIVHRLARNTAGPYACSTQNPYCPSLQSQSDDPSPTPSPPTTDSPRTPWTLLTHRDQVLGVLTIAPTVLLALGLVLWLCSCSRKRGKRAPSLFRFAIGDRRPVVAVAVAVAVAALPTTPEMNARFQSQQEAIEIDVERQAVEVELAPPAPR